MENDYLICTKCAKNLGMKIVGGHVMTSRSRADVEPSSEIEDQSEEVMPYDYPDAA